MTKSKKYHRYHKTGSKIIASTIGNIAGTSIGAGLSAATVVTGYAVIGAAAIVTAVPILPSVIAGAITAVAATAGTTICGMIGGYLSGKVAEAVTYDSDDEKESPSYKEQAFDFITNAAGSAAIGKFFEKAEQKANEKFIIGVAQKYAGNATQIIAKEGVIIAKEGVKRAASSCNIM